jgi:DNA polymerase III sliding clamp (beta) subunit (PCNA family)
MKVTAQNMFEALTRVQHAIFHKNGRVLLFEQNGQTFVFASNNDWNAKCFAQVLTPVQAYAEEGECYVVPAGDFRATIKMIEGEVELSGNGPHVEVSHGQGTHFRFLGLAEESRLLVDSSKSMIRVDEPIASLKMDGENFVKSLKLASVRAQDADFPVQILSKNSAIRFCGLTRRQVSIVYTTGQVDGVIRIPQTYLRAIESFVDTSKQVSVVMSESYVKITQEQSVLTIGVEADPFPQVEQVLSALERNSVSCLVRKVEAVRALELIRQGVPPKIPAFKIGFDGEELRLVAPDLNGRIVVETPLSCTNLIGSVQWSTMRLQQPFVANALKNIPTSNVKLLFPDNKLEPLIIQSDDGLVSQIVAPMR